MPPTTAASMGATAAGAVKPSIQSRPHLPHIPAPNIPAPHLPHVQPPHISAPHLPKVQAPHLQAPQFHAPHVQAPKAPGFMNEFGTWAMNLSWGARLRVAATGALLVWLVFIAFPITTVTTVSSAVGGLQLSNQSNKSGQSVQLIRNPTNNGSGKVKIAYAVSTQTPVPTKTPAPTATRKPQATRAPVTRVPTPTSAPVIAAPAYPPLPARWIDPRLGDGPQVLPHLEQVKVIPATVGHGQKFWYVTKLKFENIEESGSDHSIYVSILDESGKRTEAKLKLWGEGSGDLPDPEQKKPDDMCQCNYGIGMWGDGYGVQIVDQYPSDQVVGMIMPMRRHVNYRITYQLVTNP